MIKKIKAFYKRMPLADKMRNSYAVIFIPVIVLIIFSYVILYVTSRKTDQMIAAATVASEFSLDFKKEFDYETYLVVVENKAVEESSLQSLIDEANRILNDLEKMSVGSDNDKNLQSAQKYLKNLEIYKMRIEENLKVGGMYEANMEIWENDVQIVTALLRESMIQYIYYEIEAMQEARANYDRYYIRVFYGSLAVIAVTITMFLLLSYYIPKSVTKPLKHLSEVTGAVANGNLEIRASISDGAEVKQLGDSFNVMIEKINELLEQVTGEQIRLRKAELELLQAQINPHFLYNTLDTIVWLAESGKQDMVVSMVGSLSDFFRTSLNQGKDIISIKEELVHVQSYLAIQQVRYQDIMDYSINVPIELFEGTIPKITLQPLVENALYHGIKNKRGGGHISITGAKEDDFWVLTVTDNGIGMTEERLSEVIKSINHKSLEETDIYGVFNVNERIKLAFGEKYGLRIESKYGEGTIISVMLPMA